jgi:hypothetical protein
VFQIIGYVLRFARGARNMVLLQVVQDLALPSPPHLQLLNRARRGSQR